jgi:hypothetical protein
MPHTFFASIRMTHRYVGTYSHLDQWGSPMRFKALEPKVIDQGNDYDDAGSVLIRVIGDKKADQRLQAKALTHELTRYGCSHEYDCCGCISTSARVRHVRPGIFSVLLRSTRNY